MVRNVPPPSGLAAKALRVLQKTSPPRNYNRENQIVVMLSRSTKALKHSLDEGEIDQEEYERSMRRLQEIKTQLMSGNYSPEIEYELFW